MPVSRNSNAPEVLSRYEPYYGSNLALLSKARQGLPPEAVDDFILLSDWPNKRVEATLNKSMKAVQSSKQQKTALDAATSEKLLKLFALYSKGASVFGSVEAFADWLSRPAYGIGNRVPEEWLDTVTGMEFINDELKRIEHGDLA